MNYICANGTRCFCPTGPIQPPENFTSPAKALTVTCCHCRAHRAEIKARYKDRHNLVSHKPDSTAHLPSNALITPEQQAAINRWILSLVVRG